MNKKRNKVVNKLEARIKKVKGAIPHDIKATKGTSVTKIIMSMEDEMKTIEEWANQPSKAGGKRAGTEGNLKHALRKISIKIGTTEFSKFKEAINNDEDDSIDNGLIKDLYGSTTDPINIHGFEFVGDPSDLKEYSLTYVTRDNQPKEAFVTTVRTYLSRIKKENNL